ncbi:MAG: TIR domain-containing protein [Anaerolineae bacterium]|jgi:small GTP-binding protein|nr:TIR domain-containing protein [Anaerolineae bacterium]MBT7190470.1 TIR domain-containing protein [Anaerolineae bacterium]MBT7774234.1 TIR domain-containing protein [Anaerolineae bacterium]
MMTPYKIALKRIEEAVKTGATELNLSGLGVGRLSVFLSYAWQDKHYVDELFDSLKAVDWIDPWRDKDKILPGQDWRMTIEHALDRADVVVVCLSNEAVVKEGFVQREISIAVRVATEKPENTIYLIPLRLDDCPVPRSLSKVQYADYFGSAKETTFLNLLKALRLRYEQKIALRMKKKMQSGETGLDISHNFLTTLPAEIGGLVNLTSLDLSYNRLTSLPASIQNLKNLKELRLVGNMLPIPTEVFDKLKEPEAVLDYYFSHLKRKLNECKVLVIGEGSVGKTSLIQLLVTGKFNPREGKTEGISITKWKIKNDYKTTNNQAQINLNLWDFGGQEIMHATHQFFLTKRSLYLLVLDSRLTQEENRIEYWLKIIQSFGGGSPVLVIGNKIDQHPLDIDRTGLQKKYTNIVGILETSAATGAGIEKLKAEIAEQINNLPHIHDLLPETWFTVKTKLEDLGDKSNFITYEKYIELCAESGINDEASQRTLIDFLHDLGVVLHFQDDLRLEALGILNPHWVTNGVYKILNSRTLFQNKGVLTISMLDEILNLPEYPRSKWLFIIDMMKYFELCYNIEPDKTFLVPDLLPKDEPTGLNFNGTPTFEYAYPVLPSSIITRFIVRMNQKIDDGFVWRTGVVLKIGENKALVKADIEDKKITIAIDGLEHTRRDALSAIRYQLDEIHASIKGLNPVKRIPIPEAPNAKPVNYEFLLMLERDGQEMHLVQDGPRLVKINVRDILSGIESEFQRRKAEGTVTNIYVGGNFDGNLVVGNENQAIRDSYNKISTAKVEIELKETLKLLADAVATMNEELPTEQALEASEDLGRLVDEALMSKPNKKWYSVSIEGLIQAAENLDKLGEPVVDLSKKVLSLLTGGLAK